MIISQAAKIWLDYHRAHSRENTIRAYEFTVTKFTQNFENRENRGVASSLLTEIEAIEDIFFNRLFPFLGAMGGKKL